VVRDVFPGEVLACLEEGRLVALDGEDVVTTAAGDLLRGVGLGVHRINRDDHAGEVEEFQEPLYCRDLVGLGGDRELSNDNSGGVVERGDQVGCGPGRRPCAAHGFPRPERSRVGFPRCGCGST